MMQIISYPFIKLKKKKSSLNEMKSMKRTPCNSAISIKNNSRYNLMNKRSKYAFQGMNGKASNAKVFVKKTVSRLKFTYHQQKHLRIICEFHLMKMIIVFDSGEHSNEQRTSCILHLHKHILYR